MSFTKITDKERSGKGNTGQPDTPNLSTYAMQELLDALPNLAIDGLNRHIDELSVPSAAGNIAASVPSNVTAVANVQSILNALAVLVSDLQKSSHSHSNITVLNDITRSLFDSWQATTNLLASITSIQNALSDSQTAIPNGHAVVNAISGINYKPIILENCYPIGTIYETATLTSPATLFGGTWSEITASGSEYHRWRRTA